MINVVGKNKTFFLKLIVIVVGVLCFFCFSNNKVLADTSAPTLSSLKIDNGTLSPTFNSATTTYNVSLTSEQYSVNITATPTDSTTTITGVGTISVPMEDSTSNIILTDKSGNINTYTINFYRTPSTYKYLSGIDVDGVSVSNFNPETLEYNLTTYNSKIDIEAKNARPSQYIDGIGETNVDVGISTKIISVTSEDNLTTTNYKLNITRTHNSKLKSLAINNFGGDLSPAFASDTTVYTIIIPKNYIDLYFDVVTSDDDATYTISNNQYLKDSNGVIKITVSEPNSEDTIYKINYTKQDDLTAYDYLGKYYLKQITNTNKYKIEVWGAQGGGSTPNSSSGSRGGAGGYSTGVIELKKGDNLYIYTGGQGTYAGGFQSGGGFNGGGGGASSGYGGGGASDVRLNGNSLQDRIIVAGGGGGADNAGGTRGDGDDGSGGAGGGLSGENAFSTGSYSANTAGTQTSGNALGIGATVTANTDTGGGGGGYYGGLATNYCNGGGGGGSGYLSSKLTNASTIVGTQTMPSHDGKSTITGNTGNGYVKITTFEMDNYLKSLTFSNGTLDKSFDPKITNYTLTLDSYDYYTVISAETSSTKATVSGLGQINFDAGTTIENIVVTAEDGSTKTYTITVNKPSIDTSIKRTLLKKLSITGYESDLTPAFNPNTKDYTVNISARNIDLNINYNTYDTGASVTVTGDKYLENDTGKILVVVSENGIDSTTYTINYIKTHDELNTYSSSLTYEKFTALVDGNYFIQAWGAQGNSPDNATVYGGKGAYTSGSIYLTKGEELFVYTGEHRTDRSASFNAGSTGGSYSNNGYGGGGASDIRLVSGTWNDITSLRSRIMVAAGGGGITNISLFLNGGAGGALTGADGNNGYIKYIGEPNDPPTGATQTNGGISQTLTTSPYNTGSGAGSSGAFGVGGNANSSWGGAGGGGYYGGAGGAWTTSSISSGAGGSSYISGYFGSVAITSSTSSSPRNDSTGTSCQNGTKDVTCSIHYSNKSFINPVMISGSDTMPNHDNTDIMVGNSGSGFIKIASPTNDTYLKSLSTNSGTINESFDALKTNYTLSLGKYENEFTLSGEAHSISSTIEGLGTYSINQGETKVINIKVTSGLNDTKIYTVTATRENGDEHSTKLKDLSIDGYELNQTFNSNTLEYNIKLIDGVMDVNVNTTKYDAAASVNVTGNSYMNNSTGVIEVTITEDNIDTTTYKVNYTKVSNVSLYSYKATYQTFTAPENGNYKVELWGAQGNDAGSTRVSGGKGAYTSGSIYLTKGEVLYIYTGEHRTDTFASINSGSTGGTDCDTTNGGSVNGYGGGGATDIRLMSGAWNDATSLRSRIMVAAGGAGASNYAYPSNGGYGGELIGGNGSNGKYPSVGTANYPPTGATQTTGGTTSNFVENITGGYGNPGTFGIAGSGNASWGSGGGGGYYGGGGAGFSSNSVDSGSGGSSYISGYTGAIAVQSSSSSTPRDDSNGSLCLDGTSDNTCSIHYSGKKFTDSEMIAGNKSQPSYDGTSTQTGNSGYGYAKITMPGNDNYLKKLTSSAGVFDKVFNATTYEYTLTLDEYESSTDISATPNNDTASITGIGTYSLDNNETKDISISVTSGTGEIKIYTIHVKRNSFSEAHSTKLKALSVDGYELNQVFDSNTLEYTIHVNKSLVNLGVNYTSYDNDNNVSISGNNHLADNGKITILVSDSNTTSTTYQINYIKDIINEDAYGYTGSYKKFTAQENGNYTIELWGAAGGNGAFNGNYGTELGGLGAYTKGTINLTKGESIYIYIGGKGVSASTNTQYTTLAGGYNGGGAGVSGGGDDQAGSGGGATDVRYFGSTTPTNDDLLSNSTLGLNSRIMVASGGAGGHSYSNTAYGNNRTVFPAMNGAGLISSGNLGYWNGGIWTPGAISQTAGASFGIGGTYAYIDGVHGAGGGGGGYYGGYANTNNNGGMGAGGSSYISGHTGSVAITSSIDRTAKNSCLTGTSDNNCSIHYSGKSFNNTEMIDGNGYAWTNAVTTLNINQPTFDESSTQVGNDGNGYARITYNYLSSDNYLKSLTSSTGAFDKEFNENTQVYALNLDVNTSDFTINAESYSTSASISGLGRYTINPGETKVINVLVTSESGETRTYAITVTRDKLADGIHSTKLSSLNISEYNEFADKFSANTTEYSLDISPRTFDLDINATPLDASATVVIAGNTYLKNSGVISITVSYPGLNDTVYKINYTKGLKDASGYDYTGEYETYTVPYSGTYHIEAWGAQGGSGASSSTTYPGGKGAYTSGDIYLEKDEKLYIYVGGKGTDHSYISGALAKGGYNGGGAGGDDPDTGSTSQSGGAGGGASDISLLPEAVTYDATNARYVRSSSSYASRIMVAAGGGGGANNSGTNGTGAAGGGLKVAGYTVKNVGTAYTIKDGSQTSGYAFGYGINGSLKMTSYLGGGGGGYYTGYVSINPTIDAGPKEGIGGTSYISGHTGSVAITNNGNLNAISTTGGTICLTGTSENSCSVHYSGKAFTNTIMIDGNGYNWTTSRKNLVNQPTISGSNTQVGNSGNGYVKITPITTSEDNYLTDITSSSGTLDKTFDPSLTEYNLVIDKYDAYVNIEGILSDSNAKVIGNGVYYLEENESKDVTLAVTSASGKVKNYIVHVSRPSVGTEHNSKLKTLTIKDFNENLNPEFLSTKNTYSLDLPESEIDINLTYTTYDTDATVKVEHNLHLTSLTGTVKITVSAPNVEDTIYYINYTKVTNLINTFSYTGAEQIFIAPITGSYKLEAWGAMGGYRGNASLAGAGGYATGVIKLKKNEQVYLYVGGSGASGGFNGGGYAPWGGHAGGATDARIDGNTLYNRILVAGGGGSVGASDRYGMYGGGESGGSTGQTYGSGGNGASMSAAGEYRGSFGIGGDGATWSGGYAGAGGGGWYGGGGANPDGSGDDDRGGGGGSGFAWSTKYQSYVPTDYKVSNSRLLTDVSLIAGNASMPNYTGDAQMTGNRSDGKFKTTLIADKSKDNYLNTLTSDHGTFDKDFDPTITEYNLHLDKYTIDFKLDGTLSDTNSTIVGLELYQIDAGTTKDVNIVVTSLSGDTKTYTIHVTRDAITEKNTYLKELSVENSTDNVSPRFDPKTLTYSVDFAKAEIDANIIATAFDSDAKVTISGNKYIKDATGVITVTVSEDGISPTTYTINYNKITITSPENNFSYTGSYITYVAPISGKYKLDVWGAQGGGSTPNSSSGSRGGAGGYSTGIIKLYKGEKAYIYVGGQGTYASSYQTGGGWNGGGNGGTAGYGGGGATDIRVGGLDLSNRVIVAGGGGGADNAGGTRGDGDDGSGGAGGGLSSEGYYIGGSLVNSIATQTTGYQLGIGQTVGTNTDTGGAGGGYYGGYVSNNCNGGGSGGSGYISSSLESANTILGTLDVPTHDLSTTMKGNTGNGYAKITLSNVSSKDNYLTNITVNKGELTPTFDKFTNEYNVTVNAEDYLIDIEGRTSDDTATISGAGEHLVPAGTTTFPIAVTSESGDIKIYNVNVTRPSSNDSSVQNIEITGLVPSICEANTSYCKLNPATFDKKTDTYVMTVPSGIRELEFTTTKNHYYESIVGGGIVKLAGGDNNITIEITSEDGKSKTVYNYEIYRDMTGDNYLDKLEVVNPKVDINFNYLITEYSFKVDNSVTSLDLNVVTDDKNATYTIEGNTNLQVGMNYVNVIVTAANGDVRTYSLSVYRVASGNVLLSSLTAVNGTTNYTLSPEFDSIKTSYTLNVDNSVTYLNVTGTAQDKTTTVTGNNKYTLNTGLNEITIMTTAQDGSIEHYKLIVTRAKSSNNNIKSLNIANETLTPTFSKDVLSYNMTVNPDVKALDLSVVLEDSTAKFEVLNNANFGIGRNDVTIRVTAENGEIKDYIIHVDRIGSDVNYLSSLGITDQDIKFNKDTLEYSVNYPNSTTKVSVSGEKEDSLSTISGLGNYYLVTGNNDLKVNVTSETGKIRTYVIHAFRAYETDASLKNIEISTGELTPTFNKDTKEYSVNVGHDISSINIKGVPTSSTAKVVGNQTYELQTGVNTITLNVTAEDGLTTDTYKVNVTRDISSNANLKNLTIHEAAITPTFDAMTINYTAKVRYGVTSVNIDAIPEDNNSTVVITGNNDLKVGNNTVSITVTSQDGTIKTYLINVIRHDVSSVDLDLTSLNVSACTLNFDGKTYYYECETPFENSTTNISATSNEKNTVSGTGNDLKLNVGRNEFSVRVTNEDEEQDYQIIINRLKNNESRLSNITINNGTLASEFSSDTYIYDVTTEDLNLDLGFVKLDNDEEISVTGNDTEFKEGTNVVKVIVSSPSKEKTSTYMLNVNKVKNTDTYLSSLNVLEHSINPTFDKNTSTYNLTVNDEVTSIYVNATSEYKYATIIGTGTHTLNLGENDINVIVTSESGIDRTYIIKVTRIGSSDATLNGLSVLDHEITPDFSKDVTEYSLNVPYNVSSVNIEANPSNEEATVSGEGNVLVRRGNNRLPVIVTSGNGTTKTYYVNVERDNPITSLLDNITVDNYSLDTTFNSYVYEYNVVVDNEVTSLGLNVIPIDSKATYEIIGNDNFKVGLNEVKIVVTSSDGNETTTYKLIVNRQSVSNTYLSSINVTNGTTSYDLDPIFNKTTLRYNVSVPNDVTNINLTATPENLASKITGTGKYNLVVGDNNLNIKVTSNGGISRNYYVDVVRLGSNNALIKSLTSKVGTVTKSGDNTFELSVPKGTTAISHDDFTVITQDSNATVKLQDFLDLSTGSNDYSILVTSQDGTVSKEYVVYVRYDKDSETRLKDLSTSVGTLTPTFNKDTFTYNVSIRDDINSITLTPTKINSKETITNLSELTNYALTDYETTIPINMKAEDGSTATYNVVVTKSIAVGKTLKDIKVSYDEQYCILNRCNSVTFDENTKEYTINVAAEITNVNFSYQKYNINQNVKIFKDNSEVSSYNLDVGKNIFKVVMTNSLNESTTYTYNIIRELSTDNNLASLKITSPEYEFTDFSADTLEYTAIVPYSYKEITVEATNVRPLVSSYEINGVKNLVVGNNDVTIRSIAQDGSYKTYIIHVIRAPQTDNYIKTLTVSSGTIYKLTPKFSPDVTSYSLDVPTTVSTLAIDAIPNIDTTTITGKGEFNLKLGVNTFNIVAKALNGEERTYQLIVNRAAYKNVYLSSLTINNGELSGDFSKTKINYDVHVDNTVSTLDMKIVPEDSNAYTQVIGNSNLSVGQNLIYIKVTSSDLSSTLTYTLHVTKDGSSNDYLKSIAIDEKNITDFNKETLDYSVIVDNDTDAVNVIGTPEDSTAVVTNNGIVSLNEGNNAINLVVTSQNGTIKTYTVNIYRKSSNYLSSITSDATGNIKDFDKKTYDYTINVPNETKNITLLATAEDSAATVSGNGVYTLKAGENSIVFSVVSKDSEARTYTVHVIRTPSDNNFLKYLTVAEGAITPTFDKSVNEYTVNVIDSITRLNISCAAESDEAEVEILNNNLTSKTTDVVVRVTSTSGKINDYIIHTNRQDASYFSNKLKDLAVSQGTLSPAFNADINEYVVTVPQDVNNINITATREAESATLIGAGVKDLAYGRNVFPIVVTSQDGITNTYTVIVYRSEKPDARLSDLSFNEGTLSPNFNKNTYTYTLVTSTDISFLTFKNIKTVESTATYKIIGSMILTGDAQTFSIKVTSSDNTMTRTYRINVIRNKSSNALLQDLNVNVGKLSPIFDSKVNSYELNVSEDIQSVRFTGSTVSSKASVNGLGTVALQKGSNIANITVTAENGTINTYTVIINRAYDNDNYLSDLGVKNFSISPTFDKNLTDYTLVVPYETSSIVVYGTKISSNSTVEGLGTYNLNVGDNNILIKVTAEDETSRSYNIKVTRSDIDSALINSLFVEEGELSPKFVSKTNNYNITIPNEYTSITPHIKLESTSATYEITGNESLSVGTNKVNIIVTSPSGIKNTYVLNVNRNVLSNNYLSSLTIDSGILTPTFDKSKVYYTVSVPNSTTEVNIGATTELTTTTLSGTGKYTLVNGDNTIIVSSTSSSGVVRTTKIIVTKTLATNNYLSSLTIDSGTLIPAFDKTKNSYSVTVDNNLNEVTLNATPEDSKATVTGTGLQTLKVKDNIINISVTNEDGKTNTYSVDVYRKPNGNTDITSITPSVGTLTPTVYTGNDYTLDVPNGTNVVTLGIKLFSNTSIVSGNENIILPTDKTIKSVVITAEDGTTRTINITINKAVKVTSITVNPMNTNLIIGDTYQLTPTVLPDNAVNKNVTYSSSNEKVATVSNSGLITAIGEGTATLTITSSENSNITATFGVGVINTKLVSGSLDIYRKEIDNVEESYVIGSEPNITLTDFKDLFTNNADYIKIYDNSDQEVTDTSTLVGSFMKIKLVINDKVYDELNIIVRGDVNGDGMITVSDTALFNKMILGSKEATYLLLKASDINLDGFITVADMTKTNNYILLKITTLNDVNN